MAGEVDEQTHLENDDTLVEELPGQGAEAVPPVDDATGAGEGAGEGGEGAAGESDEVVVTLGEETPPSEEEDPARAPAWLKDLRKSNREKDRRIRELEAKLNQSAPAAQTPVLGEKPTLASCEYDEAAFEAKLEEWHATKQQVEQAAKAQEDAKRAQQVAWEKKLQAHDDGKKALRVPDYDDAAANVEDHFSVVQRGILIDCAKDSAALEYALGKNPAKLKELAAIQNPAHFTWALSQLETKLKVEPRRAAPPTERVVRGSGSLAGTTDKTLEALRAEADRTGDRSKVTKYLRNKQKA
jgi:hypothetical protein